MIILYHSILKTLMNSLSFYNKEENHYRLISFNCMQANPGKFQAIAVGKKIFEKSPVFRFESVNIT